ncbi:sugar phosphate isomerase/epimerase [Mucilaginibacter agri]|uniref:Sugar phosphate isomerase/epimerase n=1 Tax=Mucilaginibacter agri TaxID=2695265 RepID=A0A966DUV8_9SPHI|nr:sugar phosphate isomerase/epimerase [Mucilaginibacter agri]NCD70856.1 sugar phosphate isomerase/epimerase [Mucilaginibacter agri]
MDFSRRNFIASTAMLSGSLLVRPVDKLDVREQNQPDMVLPNDFKLLILAPFWGFAGTIMQFAEKAKNSGFDGFEIAWGDARDKLPQVAEAAAKYDLKFGFLTNCSEGDPQKYFDTYKNDLEKIVSQKIAKPLYVNSQTGRDFFPFEENCKYIEFAKKLSDSSGIPIYHETHRSRMLFAAHIAQPFIQKYKDISLTLDISHWCCVHETMLADLAPFVDSAIAHAHHIHARIGHPEGPQVNHPAAPEWANVVEQHLKWWDKVIAQRIKAGAKYQTILTEFGPATYMPTLPFTQQPVSDQWEVNVSMKDILRKRYQ